MNMYFKFPTSISLNKKTIRNDKLKHIQFKDFWSGFDEKNNYFTRLLTKYGYEFKIVNTDPDIIIFSVFGMYHKRVSYSTRNIQDKNIKKCFYTGENKSLIKGANLNITFENTSKYNNIRLPLWILYGYDKNIQLVKKESEGFCCFVYSNNVKHRNAFCIKLSNYKKVYCGGGCINNVGGKVKNKLKFQKKYKFCITYENSVQPGYTTEKILDAYKSNCIPIYYGSETIKDDFNPETFINAHDFDNNDDLINYIKKVDTDESLYNSYMNKPIFSKMWLDIFNGSEETYFKNIAQKIME